MKNKIRISKKLKKSRGEMITDAPAVLDWMENNCKKCEFYNNEWLAFDDCNCEIYYYIALSFALGKVPLWLEHYVGRNFDCACACRKQKI